MSQEHHAVGFGRMVRVVIAVFILMTGLLATLGTTVIYDDEDDHIFVFITGYWNVSYSGNMAGHTSLYISASDGVISGRWMSGGSEEIEGTVDGSFVYFYWSTGDVTVTHRGTVSGSVIAGTWEDTKGNSGSWSAEKTS